MALKNLYFPHEVDASSNPKLISLNREMGIAGIGIYWVLIEALYQNDGEMSEKDILEVAWQNHIENEDMLKVVAKVLLKKPSKKDNCEHYYSNGVKKRIAEREAKSSKARESASRRWKKPTAPVRLKAPTPDWLAKSNEERKQKILKEKSEIDKEPKKMSAEEVKVLFGEEDDK